MTRTIVALGLLAAAGGVGLLVLDRLQRRGDFTLWGLFASSGLLVAAAGVPAALVAGRDLSAAEVWLGRLSTLTLLGVGMLALLRWLSGWAPARLPGEALWLAGTVYSLCLLIVEIAAGDGIEQRTWQIPLALLALWTAPKLDPASVIQAAKLVLGAFMLLTIVVMAVGAPDAWTVATSSFLPWTEVRLRGATPHPNTLAPLMVTYLLLEHLQPSRTAVRFAGSTLAVLFLVLSQSKTGLIGAGVVLAVQWLRPPSHRRPRHVVGLALMAGLVGATVVLLDSPTQALVDPESLESIRTLTGRTRLWAFAFEAWQSEPVLGAGPQVFRRYAESTGFTWAGQGHNQFVQSLAEGGLVGILGVLAYVGAMCTAAFRVARISHWGSISIVALLIIRCMTETPLRRLSFEHLLVLALLFAWERADTAKPPSPATLAPVEPQVRVGARV